MILMKLLNKRSLLRQFTTLLPRLSVLVLFGLLVYSFFPKLGNSVVSAAQTVTEEAKAVWTEVKDLRVGDFLYTRNGWKEIESIEYIQEPTTVYNLSVSYPNTFWANGILVHNKDNTWGRVLLNGDPVERVVTYTEYNYSDLLPVATKSFNWAVGSGGYLTDGLNDDYFTGNLTSFRAGLYRYSFNVIPGDGYRCTSSVVYRSHVSGSYNEMGCSTPVRDSPFRTGDSNKILFYIEPDTDEITCQMTSGDVSVSQGDIVTLTVDASVSGGMMGGKMITQVNFYYAYEVAEGNCSTDETGYCSGTIWNLIGTDSHSASSGTWTVDWNTDGYSTGNYKVVANVVDSSGQWCSGNPCGVCGSTAISCAECVGNVFIDGGITLSGRAYCVDEFTNVQIPQVGIPIRSVSNDGFFDTYTPVAITDTDGNWTATLSRSLWEGDAAGSIRPDCGGNYCTYCSHAIWCGDPVTCEDSNVEGVAFDISNNIYEWNGCQRGSVGVPPLGLANDNVSFNLGYCPASCEITGINDIEFNGAGEVKETTPLTINTTGGGTIRDVQFTVNSPAIAEITKNYLPFNPDETTTYGVEMRSLSVGTSSYSAAATLNGASSPCDTKSANITVNPPDAWCQIDKGDLIVGATADPTTSTASIDVTVPVDQFLMTGAPPGLPVAGGSITTDTDKISSTGWRVTGAPYAGELPSYEGFWKKISGKIIPVSINIAGVIETQLTSGGTEYPVSSGYYYFYYDGLSGDLDIEDFDDPSDPDDTVNLSARKVIVFADSNVNINDKIRLTKGQGFLMIIASGDITIDPSVKDASGNTPDLDPELEGVYYTDSDFKTGTDGAGKDNQLRIRGVVVAGNTAGRGVVAQRSPAYSEVPGEIFEYGPDQNILIPPELSRRPLTWKEVLP